MYVTKKGMANAVSNMTKHLEQVSAALAVSHRFLCPAGCVCMIVLVYGTARTLPFFPMLLEEFSPGLGD